MSTLMEAVEKLEQAVGAVDKANCPTHADCANWKPGQGICVEWNRPIDPNTPVCSRFLPAVGPRREHLDFKVMLSREIPPKKPVVIPRPTLNRVIKAERVKEQEANTMPQEPLAAEKIDELLHLLVDEKLSHRKISQELGISSATVHRYINKAVAEGHIKRTGTGRYVWAGPFAKNEAKEPAKEPTEHGLNEVESLLVPGPKDVIEQLEARIKEHEERLTSLERRVGELDTVCAGEFENIDDQLAAQQKQIGSLKADYGDLHNFVERNDAKKQNQIDALANEIARLREDVDKLLAADARLSARILSLLEMQMGADVRKAGAA